MVEPVNLRQFRKRKQRGEKAARAEENRKLHALPVALRKKTAQENRLASGKLDGKKLEGKDPA